jgi:hypothetical protein
MGLRGRYNDSKMAAPIVSDNKATIRSLNLVELLPGVNSWTDVRDRLSLAKVPHAAIDSFIQTHAG